MYMLFTLFLALASAGCGAVLGVDDYSVANTSGDAGLLDGGDTPECTTNRECSERSGLEPDNTMAPGPSVCVKPAGRCVRLLSEDCSTVTGDYLNEKAIVIGSLFSTTGAQASTNIARQQSATLAIEEINAAGGIPSGATSADGRPLVMVSCDESVNLLRAGRHLVEELKVPAIIGPNTSQDTLDLSNKLTITSGTLLMSPTAVASSIADLLDNGLTWQIIPTDVQRAPLMIQEISTLETRLRQARNRQEIRLSVIYRDDALGQGTRSALTTLTLNGKPLVDPLNLGNNVRIDPYDPKVTGQKSIVDSNVSFAPDIIVLAGPAESITGIMVPLEQAWTGPPQSRPEYVLIDSAKVPELLQAVTGNDDLRRRIRGTGVTPGVRSVAVNDAFMVSYATRYMGQPANIFGMGPAYDSTYAIAYAIASLRGAPLTGASIAKGLGQLSGGATTIEIQNTKILAAFRKLTGGEAITAIGTFSMLQWDDSGAALGGTIELWCVSSPNGKATYDRSGLMLDTATGQSIGQYTQCP
jgi:ABC-type branched-subunit amino acid transport system substrate-binding protein